MVTFVPAMLLVFGVGTGLAMPIAGGQTPGAQSRTRTIQVSRGDFEPERGELQAPRAALREPGIGASRSQEVQAPRADSVQAPRAKVAQAAHATEIKEPRWRED